MVEQSYFGVIDVLDMCLKSLPRRHNRSSRKGANSHRSRSPDHQPGMLNGRVRREQQPRGVRPPPPPPLAKNARMEYYDSCDDVDVRIRDAQDDHGDAIMSNAAYSPANNIQKLKTNMSHMLH